MHIAQMTFRFSLHYLLLSNRNEIVKQLCSVLPWMTEHCGVSKLHNKRSHIGIGHIGVNFTEIFTKP